MHATPLVFHQAQHDTHSPNRFPEARVATGPLRNTGFEFPEQTIQKPPPPAAPLLRALLGPVGEPTAPILGLHLVALIAFLGTNAQHE